MAQRSNIFHKMRGGWWLVFKVCIYFKDLRFISKQACFSELEFHCCRKNNNEKWKLFKEYHNLRGNWQVNSINTDQVILLSVNIIKQTSTCIFNIMIRAPNCLQHHTQLKQPKYNRFVCHATIEKTPKLSNFYTEWMPKIKICILSVR